jgi:hypothetical protein
MRSCVCGLHGRLERPARALCGQQGELETARSVRCCDVVDESTGFADRTWRYGVLVDGHLNTRSPGTLNDFLKQGESFSRISSSCPNCACLRHPSDRESEISLGSRNCPCRALPPWPQIRLRLPGFEFPRVGAPAPIHEPSSAVPDLECIP